MLANPTHTRTERASVRSGASELFTCVEYSSVKATAVSVCLRILFVTLQSTNKLSGAIVGEQQLHYLRTQSSSYLFLFLYFYLNPCYPWSRHPFHDSLTPRASSGSHHPHRIHFFRQAVNPTLPSKPWFEIDHSLERLVKILVII